MGRPCLPRPGSPRRAYPQNSSRRSVFMRLLKFSSFVVLCLSASIASAAPRNDDSSALINEALDKPVKLQINTELPKAMQAIADKTGVRLKADPMVWDLLPWGEQTRVTATIENQT